MDNHVSFGNIVFGLASAQHSTGFVGCAELTEHFITSVKGCNVFACCLYCYLELDNGLKEIADAVTEIELPTDSKYVKDGIKAYLQDKRRETHEAVSKDSNLLSLRRWHYDHPEDYQEFTDLFTKAC